MARHQNGWFKIWREAWDKDLSQNVYLWGIWTALLHMATWKESQIIWEGKQRVLPPGSVVFGVGELSARWGCSRRVLQKWLKYLNDTGRIVLTTCPRGSLVSICNWSLYQANEEGEETDDRAHSDSTTGQQRGNNGALSEEGKKEEYKYKQRKRRSEVKSNFDLEKLYEAYPRKRGKTPGLKKLAKEIQSQADYDALATAIKNYSAEVAGKEQQHIKYFDTFAREWRDWVQIETNAQVFSINTKPIDLEAG